MSSLISDIFPQSLSSLVIFTRPRAHMTLDMFLGPSETIHLRLELEHMCQDLTPSQTQFETQTHDQGLQPRPNSQSFN